MIVTLFHVRFIYLSVALIDAAIPYLDIPCYHFDFPTPIYSFLAFAHSIIARQRCHFVF